LGANQIKSGRYLVAEGPRDEKDEIIEAPRWLTIDSAR